MSSLLKRVESSPLFRPRSSERRGFYEPPIILEEAKRNYIELHKQEPTSEQLQAFIESGEESKYFFKKRREQGVLV